ncbi:MAG: hypothetical protein QW035_04205 [Candidatus Anstonellales archaeon]
MKGQYFSFDSIVAALIFIMAIMLIFTYWGTARAQFLGMQSAGMEMNKVSDILMSDRGLLTNGYINPDKVAYFRDNPEALAGLANTNYRVSVYIKYTGDQPTARCPQESFLGETPVGASFKTSTQHVAVNYLNSHCISDITITLWE